MKIQFVHPPLDGAPSGGHRFNRQLLEEAARRGHPLASHPWPATADLTGLALPPGAPILWDSLFTAGLAASGSIGGTAGMLVHYLPFLDPGLDETTRDQHARCFEQVLTRLAFLLVSGQGNTDFLRKRFPGVPVESVEPGVDPAFLDRRGCAESTRNPARPRIATVANLLPAKGHGELLEVLEGLRVPDFEWHLAGADSDPDYARGLRERAACSPLASRIVFHGVLGTAALADLLAGMDLVAFPSRYEAYGMVLAEAAAVGLPIVTTRVGAAAQWVRPGETGFIIDVGDRQGLAAALTRLLEDAEFRQRCRERQLATTPPPTPAVAFDSFARALARALAAPGYGQWG